MGKPVSNHDPCHWASRNSRRRSNSSPVWAAARMRANLSVAALSKAIDVSTGVADERGIDQDAEANPRLGKGSVLRPAGQPDAVAGLNGAAKDLIDHIQRRQEPFVRSEGIAKAVLDFDDADETNRTEAREILALSHRSSSTPPRRR